MRARQPVSTARVDSPCHRLQFDAVGGRVQGRSAGQQAWAAACVGVVETAGAVAGACGRALVLL